MNKLFVIRRILLDKMDIDKMSEYMNKITLLKQMLQVVRIIHKEKVVHTDLKLASFVLVLGQFKVIDISIANAITNNTTNIECNYQVCIVSLCGRLHAD